ncbi:MAG TPA: 2-dehydropantoate 2-reductase [Trichormus sp.]
MKIAMMGTGGVGGVFGARLAESGEDVSFIARGSNLKAIKENGLLVVSDKTHELLIKPAKVTADPSEVGPVDYIFLSVKLWDTEAVAPILKPMIGENTAIISLQNGIGKDGVLQKLYHQKNVVGGVAYVAAFIMRPGVIEQRGTRQKLVFGEFTRVQSERLLRLKDACKRANINSVVSDDIERDLWEKFIVLIAMSAVTAATRTTIGTVRSEPLSRELLLEAMHEAAAIANAKNIKVSDDIVERQMDYLDSLAPEVSSSMHHDIEQGNRLELPWLSGTVVQLGKELGIPTPANKALAGVLMPHAMGRQCQSPVKST